MRQAYPAPRHAEFGRGVGSADPLDIATDPTLPPQGYRLTIRSDGTTLEHRDELGRRYGLDTLRQLGDGEDGWRVGVVEDWPDVAERAFMLDISRDRVPSMETLEWLVSILGRLRFTELQLYTEHTFAWAGHEEVWRDASPMTGDEVRALAAACTTHGLTLVPCLNGFGHMERFLRHETHRHRAECPDGAPALLGSVRTPPTTLAPTPENAAFALDLFRGYLDALPSTRIHIGGDEPFELGQGRSAADVAREGRTAVYARHLRRLIEPLVADGHEVLFWGDVLSRSPELVATLPEGTTAVGWWYAAPVESPPPLSSVLGPELVERLGMPEDAMAGFVAHTRAFAETGMPCWVAPGTSSWNSFIGRWPNARANIDDALAVGADIGARGMLLTDWGDGGHHQPLPISLPPLVHAAGAAWCGRAHDDGTVAATVDELTGISGLGADLIDLGSVDDLLGVRQFNASALCNVVIGTYAPPRRPRIDTDRVDRALEAIDRFVLPDPPEGVDRPSTIRTELDAVARLARAGVWRLAAQHDLPAPATAAVESELTEAAARHERAWRRSSRPGGLSDSLARLPGDRSR